MKRTLISIVLALLLMIFVIQCTAVSAENAPANVDIKGTWAGSEKCKDPTSTPDNITFIFTSSSPLNGDVELPSVNGPKKYKMTNGKLEGKKLSFDYTLFSSRVKGSIILHFEGNVEGDTITGVCDFSPAATYRSLSPRPPYNVKVDKKKS
jgi:hypothetical protein